MSSVVVSGKVAVYLNGVYIPNKYVTRVDMRYRLIPQISSCSLTLVGGTELLVKEDLKKCEKFVRELAGRLRGKGLRAEYNGFPAKDNDVVCVFIRVRDMWRWLFFGYVSSVSVSIEADSGVSVSLECESSLKTFRYSWLAYNVLAPSIVLGRPDAVKKINDLFKQISEGIDIYAEYIGGKTMYEAIDGLMIGEKKDRDDEMKMLLAEGSFVRGMKFEVNIWDIERDFEKYIIDLLSAVNKIYEERCVVGKDLNKYVTENNISLWGTVENLFPKRKYYVIEIVDKNDRAKFNSFLGSIAASLVPMTNVKLSLELSDKLSLLHNVLRQLPYIGWELPSGDVVFEPILFGVFGNKVVNSVGYEFSGKYEEGVSWSYDGKMIKTFAKTNVTPVSVPAVPGGEVIRPVEGFVGMKVLGESALRVFGIRMGSLEYFSDRLTENMADLYLMFEIVRSWYRVRTATVRGVWNINGLERWIYLNRPVYVKMVDGFFRLEGFNVSIGVDGVGSGTLGLVDGVLNGEGGYRYFDMVEESSRMLQSKYVITSDKVGNVFKLLKSMYDSFNLKRE